jgi:hypothetical protein
MPLRTTIVNRNPFFHLLTLASKSNMICSPVGTPAQMSAQLSVLYLCGSGKRPSLTLVP